MLKTTKSVFFPFMLLLASTVIGMSNAKATSHTLSDPPAVSWTGIPGERINLEAFTIGVGFTKAITGFVASDFTVINGEIPADGFGTPNAFGGRRVTIQPNGGSENINPVAGESATDIVLVIPANVVTATDSGMVGNVPIRRAIPYRVVPPTASFTDYPSGHNGDPFKVVVTLSEAVDDFDATDILISPAATTFTVTANPKTLDDGGMEYNYDLAVMPNPNADSIADHSEITISIALGTYTDADNNANVAVPEGQPLLIPLDATGPSSEDVTFTESPTSVDTLDEFHVTWTFSEVVTLAGEDFKVTNGLLTGFEDGNGSSTGTSLSSKASLRYTTSISSTAFRLTIKPNGNGDIVTTIRAGDVADQLRNTNEGDIVHTVTYIPPITDTDTDTDTAATEAAIRKFMLNRSNQLANNQPGLARFLQRDGCADVFANSTDSSGNVSGCVSRGQTWGEINSAWSDKDSNDSSYTLITLGGHGFVRDNTIVGGMIQLDLGDDDASNITGKGWLTGPYFVHKPNQQNVTFEGRLLYGQTDNDISIISIIPTIGTYSDSFETDRYLAQLRITGEYGYQTATLMPLLDFTYTEDTQDAYTNNPGHLIKEQNVDLTQMTLGLDFKLPLSMGRGSFDLTGGLSGIYTETNGGNEDNVFKGGRGRTELGLNYASEGDNGNGVTVTAATFYDGIGSDHESYGVNFSVGMRF